MNGREAIQWFAGKYVNAPNNSETMNILAGDLESDDVRSKVEAKFLSYFAESQELRLRKQADYGLSWRDMGLLGVFCNIVSKEIGRAHV